MLLSTPPPFEDPNLLEIGSQETLIGKLINSGNESYVGGDYMVVARLHA